MPAENRLKHGNLVIGLRIRRTLRSVSQKLLEAPQLTYSNYLIRQGEMYRFFGLMMDQSENLKKDRQRYDYPQSIYVKQAVQFMSLNYEHHIKIDSLAGSDRHHQELPDKSFQKELQTSPQEFLINLRLEKAKFAIGKCLNFGNFGCCGVQRPAGIFQEVQGKFGLSPKAYREAKPTLVLKNKKASISRRHRCEAQIHVNIYRNEAGIIKITKGRIQHYVSQL